jgi:hypothetical protein
MPRILVRSHKNPFTVADAETTRASNLIGSNTGNLVFSQAVFRLLSTPDTRLKTSGVAKYKPSRINAGFDHVVIPLANAFRPGYTNTLDSLTAVIEQLKVPVTVVGVGAQADLEGEQREADQVDPATKRFVSAVLEHSPSIGVRGEFTRNYLRGLGFGDEHVKVIGCPSMFMYGPDLRIERKVDALTAESPIAFNVSPYVHAMGPISLDHAARYPNLVYMGQNMQTLTMMLDGIYPGKHARMSKAGAPVTLQHPLIRENRVRFFLDPQTWFSHLAQYDFSFGTRIHGNIAALLAGTPALLLAHDSRTLELADYHQIPHRVIDSLPDTPDAAALYAEADWSKLNDGHAARWGEFSDFLHQHDLTHVYDEGQDASRFDDKLAATEFPPPVETLMGLPPEELYAMKRTIDEQRDELRKAAEERKALNRRMSSTPPTLQRRLKRKLRRILKR